MSQSDHSDSATEEATVSKTQRRKGNKGPEKMTEYEKQRMKRIEQNKERMKAMGLDKMASLVMGSVPISKKDNKKGKKKVGLEDDDEEYKPSDIDEESGSSSGSDDEDEDKVCVSKTKVGAQTQVELKDKQLRMEDAVNATKAAIEESVVVGGGCCLLRLSLKINEIKKLMDNEEHKTKRKNSTPSKNISKRSGIAHTVDDDDEALMKAFALSLQHSSGFLDVENKTPPQRSDAKASNVENFGRKQSVRKDDSGKRKRKNLLTSRVQMTEDELILHFFQFDEAGKGGINIRDLQRVAASHDFTWKDEEMEHMIHFFDSDGDGKLSLEDFTKIVERCNMRQGSENAERASFNGIMSE